MFRGFKSRNQPKLIRIYDIQFYTYTYKALTNSNLKLHKQLPTLSTTSELDLDTFVHKLCQVQHGFFPASRLKQSVHNQLYIHTFIHEYTKLMKDLPYLDWVFSTNSTLSDFTESVSKEQQQLFSNNLNKKKTHPSESILHT